MLDDIIDGHSTCIFFLSTPCLSIFKCYIVPTVLRFCDDASDRVFCTACPQKQGVYRIMSRRHAEKHSKQDMHIRRAENIKKRLSEARKPRVSAAAPVGPDPSLSPAGHDNFSINFDCVDDAPIDMQADGPSVVPEPDSEYPLADLWNKIVSSRTLQLDGEFPDLFAELQESVASGHIAISTPIVPTNKTCELVDDSASDFGIEIPGK